MPDPYASIGSADAELQERLAAVLELRAAEPQQRAMLNAYLAELQLPQSAIALDVGCGTGAVTRALAELPGIREVIGIDPSSIFVEKARELGSGIARLSFQTGDARAIQFPDASFDLVVFHTVLCHVPEPERALREARRVLRPGGWLAVFDGDYVTASVAIGAFDPLQATVEAMMANFVHNPWLTRRLNRTLKTTGFAVTSFRSHGYVQTAQPGYMLTIVDRGADLLAAGRVVGDAQAHALKDEARRRVDAGEFFGHISFVSVIARAVGGKPISGYTLRQAIASDVSAIQRVRHSVRENRLVSTSISDDQVREAIEHTGRGWVIEAAGQVVAFAIGNATNGNVWALFVHPDHERRGYGRLLHDATVEWLCSQGLERLWLTTEPDTRAQGFYEAAGWHCVGSTPSGESRYERAAERPDVTCIPGPCSAG